MSAVVDIAELDADGFAGAVEDLADVLHACVLDGASVGFVLPFSIEDAMAFWRGLIPAVRDGGRRLLVARLERRVVGAVQLVLAMPANGQHRADIVKLLVHPSARRRGMARALMRRAEALARAERRSLLILDTRQGDAAEPLYRALGFALTGVVPAYACSIHGVPEPCSFMHKVLEAIPGA
jgi:ribosomal protein S18 acetylase RimI-like enzyme